MEFFTIVLCEMTGQTFAIWPYVSSRCTFFSLTVHRREVGMSSPSEVSPLWGAVDNFFCQKGGEISIQGEGILEILPPSFECCNGSVLREGPLFWSSVWIHTLTIRNSEGILSFRWDGALLRVHPNHRIGWLVVAWISKTTLGLAGFLALRDVD